MADEILVKYQSDFSAVEAKLTAYENKLRSAEQTGIAGTKNVEKSVNKLGDAFEEVGKRAAASLIVDKTNSITKAAINVQSLKAQFKEATNEVGRLTAQFGALDARTLAAAKNAGNLKNQINDVNKQINALNPEAKFNAFIGVTQGVSGALFAAQGAMALFGSESEKTKELLSKFVGAINLAAGLNQLGGLKSAFTSLASVLGITTSLTQKQAESIADVADESIVSAENIKTAASATTIASNSQKIYGDAAKKAAVAQAALNKTILANPYVIAAAAIIALVGAFILLTRNADDSLDKLQEIEGILKSINDVAKARKRIDDEFIQSLQGQIDLRKAQGAGDKTVAELQVGLQQQRLADLRAEKTQAELNFDEISRQQDVLYKNTKIDAEKKKALQDDLLKAQNDNIARRKEIPAEEAKLSNDILVIQAQFQTTSLEKEKKFNEDRLKAKKDLALKIGQLEVDAIKNDEERQRAQLLFNFDKELGIVSDSLDKRLIEYSEFNSAVLALQNKLTNDLSKIQPIPKAPVLKPLAGTSKLKTTFSQSFVLTPEEIEAIKETQRAQAAEIIEFSSSVMNELFSFAGGDFDAELDQLNIRNQIILDGLDAEAAALEKKNERGAISDRAYQNEKDKLDKKKEENLKKFLAEEKKIKNQQAQAEWQKAIFDVISQTAVAIMKAAPDIPLQILTGALGALQLANVVAHPPPKFFKGTKYVKGDGYRDGVDTVPSWLTKGERVIDIHKNKKNWEIYEAIDNNKLDELIWRKHVIPVVIDFQKKQAEKQQERISQSMGRAMMTGTSGLTDGQMKKMFRNGMPITNVNDLKQAYKEAMQESQPRHYGTW